MANTVNKTRRLLKREKRKEFWSTRKGGQKGQARRNRRSNLLKAQVEAKSAKLVAKTNPEPAESACPSTN